MTDKFITLQEASEKNGWSEARLLRMASEGKISFFYKFNLLNTELREILITPFATHTIPRNIQDKAHATLLPPEDERHITDKTFSAVKGPGPDEIITLELAASMALALLEGKPVFITYGRLPDGTVFKVVSPDGGLPINKDEILLSTTFWYYPPPNEWLGKKKWSALSAMMLFAGLNPTNTSVPVWDDRRKLWTLASMERLGANLNGSHIAFLSKEDLKLHLLNIEKEAQRSLENAGADYYNTMRIIIIANLRRNQQLAEEDGGPGILFHNQSNTDSRIAELGMDRPESRKSIPVPPFALNDLRDNTAYHACNIHLQYYDESERTLNIFIERWLESKGRNFSEFDTMRTDTAPTNTLLRWAVEEILVQKIPWWNDAVDENLINNSIVDLQKEILNQLYMQQERDSADNDPPQAKTDKEKYWIILFRHIIKERAKKKTKEAALKISAPEAWDLIKTVNKNLDFLDLSEYVESDTLAYQATSKLQFIDPKTSEKVGKDFGYGTFENKLGLFKKNPPHDLFD